MQFAGFRADDAGRSKRLPAATHRLSSVHVIAA
jgi:hypothetical protein